MEYKLIYLKETGKLRFGGKNISHYNKYDDPKDIPLFFSDQTPVTAGLKLMENNGSVIIADADKVEEVIADLGDEKVEKDNSSDTVVDKEDDDIAPEGESDEDTEETTDDGEEEADDNEEEETEDEEVKGFTEEGLNELTSAELDDICREEDIPGFSTRDKEGKIELILNNQ